MADPQFETVETFKARHGNLDSDEEIAVIELLRDATELILLAAEGSEAGWVTDPAAAITAGDVPRRIRQVCDAVAFRAFDNPSALAQMSSQDQSASYVRGQTPDAVFLTGDEYESVLTAAATSSFRAMTLVSPYSGDA